MLNNSANKNFIKKDFVISHRKNLNKFRDNNHYHNAYEIFYLLKGNGKYFIKDKSYNMSSNSLFIIKNFYIHRVNVDKNSYYERFVIHFKKEIFDKLLNNNTNFKKNLLSPEEVIYIQLSPTQKKHIIKIMEKIILEKEQKKLGYKPIANAYIIELFVFLSRLIENYSQNHNNEKSNDRLKKIINFINENYSKKLDLKKIANEFYINKYYLCHLFKKETGFTIIEYLNNKRIMEAQKILKKNNKTITEIAYKVGFNNLSHFGRTFKKLTGLTPSEFKKIFQ